MNHVVANEFPIIDERLGKRILRFALTPDGASKGEVEEFIIDAYVRNNASELHIEIPMLHLLEQTISERRDWQEEDLVFSVVEDKPVFDAIKEDLLCLIAQIDSFKYKETK